MNVRSYLPTNPRFFRFALGGGLNTLITYGLYFLLSTFLNYQWAFFTAYFAGIMIAYWFNATVVFHVGLSWKRLFIYPTTYFIQYAASAFLLYILVETMHITSILAPLFITLLMLPFTFLINKWVLDRK